MGFLGFKKKKGKDKKEDGKGPGGDVVGEQPSQTGTTTEANVPAAQQQQQHQQELQKQDHLPPQSPPQVQQQQQAPPAATVTDIPVGDPAFAKADVTRDLVKKFISDIWNRGELDLIPQVCSPKIRFNGNTGLDKIGHDGFARMVATIHGALSDYHCEIHSMVVENNKAFCRLRFSGKHTGDLLGYPPTGRVVSWMGATEFTCMNGRILKVWELGDMKTLEEQLQLRAESDFHAAR
ncbi:SnoaL-like polyketide cyclase [Seminavis robusta]|uniref:SnoaL-like polyketide cyclase n=1 Tax=Seminavis robusta TaxID=568900 RepID=A0A9N8DH67_9STRA|nr:SnoaL-like polyketide cyclase [Seminavis robusta]|eukprot:Sro143_g066610.1 SnoaL-like polyketide cyclase (236) ;mRNA; r:51269-51976